MSTEKPRLLNVIGEMWDFVALFRGFDRDLDSRFISFYKPFLKGDIPRSRIIEFHEKTKLAIVWPFKIIQRIRLLRKHIHEQRPQYVISHHDDANFTVMFARPFISVHPQPKYIAWIRASPERGYESKSYSLFVRTMGSFVYKRFDAIVTPSEGNREQIIKLYGIAPSKVHAWPNPFDPQRLAALARKPAPASVNLRRGKPVIVTVGRLTEQKGQWHLIRAFAVLKKKHPKAQLIIIGDGELKEKLVALTKDLGVQDSVSFPGFLENPYSVLSKADVFVQPSLWETFGNVLVECMSCDTPIISTDCASGPRDILESKKPATKTIVEAKAGLLIPVFDGVWRTTEPLVWQEKILVDAMDDVLTNAALRKRLVTHGREVRKTYDFTHNRYDTKLAALFTK